MNLASAHRRRRWTVALAACALAFAVPAHVSCSKPAARPNVVLIVIDTLRADHLGCYGFTRPISPEIDEFAKGGTLFTECVAQAPWTLPSMTSMLTGRYLMRHREWPEPKYVPLAECFQKSGYATIGVSANVLLAKDHHFDRGYDHYDASWGPKDNDGKPLDMLYDAIFPPVEAALKGNDGGREKPLFLFVQPFDPHFSYKAHPQYDAQLPLDQAAPVTPEGWQAQELARFGEKGPPDDPDWTERIAALRHNRGLYEQEVRFTDEWIGKILARLKELHVLDDAIVAIVSDHGEGLWEHVNKGSLEMLKKQFTDPSKGGPDGYFFQGHANHVYEEAIRTPFILAGRGVPKGLRIDEPVENVDVYATLCALSGVERPKLTDGHAQLEGHDLSAFFQRGERFEQTKREYTFSYAYLTATVRERSTGLKLIVPTCSYTDLALHGVRSELFDLKADPDERVNLWAERPEDVQRLLAVLQKQIVDHFAPTTWGLKKPEENMILTTLGYFGAEGTPPDPSVICAPSEDAK